MSQRKFCVNEFKTSSDKQVFEEQGSPLLNFYVVLPLRLTQVEIPDVAQQVNNPT